MDGGRTEARSLIDVFRVFTGRDSTVTLRGDREWAAESLLLEMQQWAPTAIWKAHGGLLRRLATDEVESLISDAIQALALAATSSKFNFRGLSEESARAWSRKVLVNHVASELRERQRRKELDAGELDATREAAAEPPDFDVADSETPAAFFDLARAMTTLRALRRRLFTTHRPRDAESKMRAVWCYIAYLSGATVEEQVRALSNESDLNDTCDPPLAVDRRRKNRV